MDKKDKLEGAQIQKGLEDFLEQELYGAAGNPAMGQGEAGSKSSSRKGGELDLSLAQPSNETDLRISYQPDELDISLAKPVSRSGGDRDSAGMRREESGKAPSANMRREDSGRTIRTNARLEKDGRTGQPEKRTDSRESGQREMSQKKKQADTRNRKKNSTAGKRKEPQSVKGKNKKQEKSKKKKNRVVKVLVFIAALFVVGIFILHGLVGSVYKKMEYKEAEGFTSEPMKEDGVINVLLIGNDSRLAGDDGRSDAMILVSISDKTKTITMTSFLRDMYVEIPGHDGNRLNAAYAYGGAELLMETIELNFGIPIHRYALVNFQAFANLVDAVGGIDLDLTNDEVNWINAYLMEYNQLEGKDLATDFLDPSLSGNLHLNGPQALAFTRNRYIGTDFGRTERQRKVLSAVIKKLPGTVLTNGGELAEGLFPNLTTNLKQGECFNLSLNAWKFLGYEMVQQCVPLEGTYSNADIRGMAVLQVDFDTNKQFLKSTLYGE